MLILSRQNEPAEYKAPLMNIFQSKIKCYCLLFVTLMKMLHIHFFTFLIRYLHTLESVWFLTIRIWFLTIWFITKIVGWKPCLRQTFKRHTLRTYKNNYIFTLESARAAQHVSTRTKTLHMQCFNCLQPVTTVFV